MVLFVFATSDSGDCCLFGCLLRCILGVDLLVISLGFCLRVVLFTVGVIVSGWFAFVVYRFSGWLRLGVGL